MSSFSAYTVHTWASLATRLHLQVPWHCKANPLPKSQGLPNGTFCPQFLFTLWTRNTVLWLLRPPFLYEFTCQMKRKLLMCLAANLKLKEREGREAFLLHNKQCKNWQCLSRSPVSEPVGISPTAPGEGRARLWRTKLSQRQHSPAPEMFTLTYTWTCCK